MCRLTLLLLLGAALANSIHNEYVVHEKRSFEPFNKGWVQQSPAPRNDVLTVRISLAQNNIEDGHGHLLDTSNPNSPNFAKHWTPQQVQEFFSPSESSLAAVREWLSTAGIESRRHRMTQSRSHVRFHATVDELERLLGTQYEIWEDHNGQQSISCEQYQVPAHLAHHIDFISPTTSMTVWQTALRQSRKWLAKRSLGVEQTVRHGKTHNQTSCAELVTPQRIRQLYGFNKNDAAVADNDLGIFEAGLGYAQEDLDLFFKEYTSIPSGTHPELRSIAGGVAPVPLNESAAEPTLDFDLAYPIVYPQGIQLFQVYSPETAVSSANYGVTDIFLDAVDATYCASDDPSIDPAFPDATYNDTLQCGAYNLTNVLSVSYIENENLFLPAYLERQCNEFMKLSLMGTSIIVASGDNGTVGRGVGGGCLSGGRDNPGFPASCPWVTTVGATQIPVNGTAKSREIAVDPKNKLGGNSTTEFSSGGGFSNVFPLASWQENAVSNYLKHNNRSRSLFNQSGRAFPDVSAVGWNIATYTQGIAAPNSGTSASTPIFASLITRINGERLKMGKKSLGFLNQILYRYLDMFEDVIDGYNLGCDAQVGFETAKGWDPVTGLGTPKFQKMRERLLALP